MDVDEVRQVWTQLHQTPVELDSIAAVTARQLGKGVMKLQRVSLANLIQAPLIAGNGIDGPSDHSLGQIDGDRLAVKDRLADVEATEVDRRVKLVEKCLECRWQDAERFLPDLRLPY